MKNIFKIVFIHILIICTPYIVKSQSNAIRINQLGYYPNANKIAFVVFTKAEKFDLINAADNKVVYTGILSSEEFWKDAGDSIKICDFSSFTEKGTYKIRIPEFGESYTFEISETVYRKAAYASLKSFYYQRCSYELTEQYAGLWARPAGHPDTNCILHSSTGQSGNIASPGGWYDAGDFGKYVINAGISVGTMLSFHENFKSYFADGSINIPESNNKKNDLLDEIKYELDWLKTMQDKDGGVFFKLSTLNFAGFVMPHKSTATRYVIGKATASSLDFAAMMAMAGRIYSNYDSVYAVDCIHRAEKAWSWAKTNPSIFFKNPSGVSTGEYGNGDVNDEFIWAASELFITTQKEEYKTYLESKNSSVRYWSAPGWPYVQPLAALSLATVENGLTASFLNDIKKSIVSTSDKWLNEISSSPCRIPDFRFNWGSNSEIANIGVGLLYAYIISKDQKYVNGAVECANYLLGKNATGFSFVSGYGSRTPLNFHHRASVSDGIVQPIPGFISGGSNAAKEDGEVYPHKEPAKCFVDVTGSYASNEVCINWNAPLTVLLAGIDAILGNNSTVIFGMQNSANNPPSITISSPRYNSNIGSNIALNVKCKASDPDIISMVELYIDSHFIDVLKTAPYEWTHNNLSTGGHTVTILASDNEGLSAGKTNVFNVYDATFINSFNVSEFSLKVFPKNENQQLNLQYNTTINSPIEFKMYNTFGQVIQVRKVEKNFPVTGEFVWNLAHKLNKGIYVITMQQNGNNIAACKFNTI